MKPKILIVDDASENIHILSNMLKDDFKIVAATSGEKGLALALKDPKPDLIVLDIIMPEMDGYEVCEKLKENPETADIPVVFLTSLHSNNDIERGFECGASEFITKPVVKSIVRNRLLNQLKVSSTFKKIDLKEEIEETKDTVMIVDDAFENIEVIMEILKEQYNVIYADSGQKALDILNVQKPDLILLDILIPDIDGFEICKRIKSDKKLQDIPIVFLTILENSKDIVEGLNLGAVDYVCKPVEPVVLKAKINTHLKLKHYQDKLIEQLKQKDDILYRQSKMATLGEMFENITHQWKQPLSVITLSNETIKLERDYGKLSEESLFNSLGDIEDSTKYLIQTINDFRDFLDEDSKKEYFNVKEIIDKSIKLLASKIRNKDITLQNHVLDLEVLNRKNDLIQVLMNIIGNAIDALLLKKEGYKNITISSRVNKNMVIINILDNGGGIPEDIMDKVFEKYVSTKKRGKGAGIGLYMSKKLVEESLDGFIRCTNEENGANFEISFPVK